MFKIKDILLTSNSHVVIMSKTNYRLFEICCSIIRTTEIFSDELLESEIERLEAGNNEIRIWLKKEERVYHD